jgi:hypothetical protein
LQRASLGKTQECDSMSSIHEQAMNYVYQQVLQRLLGYFDDQSARHYNC